MSNFDHKLALCWGTLSPSPLYSRHPSVTESVVLPPDLEGSMEQRRDGCGTTIAPSPADHGTYGD